MHKGFAVYIALVFLLSSGTFAASEQIQQFDVGASNVGAVTGPGVGATASVQLLPVANSQVATDGSGTIKNLQIGNVTVLQGGTAAGAYGIYGFNQDALASGSQWQTLSHFLSPALQGQSLYTDLSQQDVFSVGLGGSAMALQSAIGSQKQYIMTPQGFSINVQIFGLGQLDGVGNGNSIVHGRNFSIQRTR